MFMPLPPIGVVFGLSVLPMAANACMILFYRKDFSNVLHTQARFNGCALQLNALYIDSLNARNKSAYISFVLVNADDEVWQARGFVIISK